MVVGVMCLIFNAYIAGIREKYNLPGLVVALRQDGQSDMVTASGIIRKQGSLIIYRH